MTNRTVRIGVLNGPSRIGVEAVVGRVNAAGGVCGRRLELVVEDAALPDGRDNSRAALRSLIRRGVFVVVGAPSSAGFDTALAAGDIDESGVPVVGTDGLSSAQSQSAWVWPVGASTLSSARLVAYYAYRYRLVRTFAVVYEQSYPGAVQGKDAFVETAGTYGGRVLAQQELDPRADSFSAQARDLRASCGRDGCDAVLLLLNNHTAARWMSTDGAPGGRRLTMALQPLLSTRFARECGNPCHNLLIWTGYLPPLELYGSLPEMTAYVNEVRSVDSNADVFDAAVEAGYVGASMLVDALREAGRSLTRSRLRDVLDHMDYASDLVPGLSWRAGDHMGNVSARAVTLQHQGSFGGWWDYGTGWIQDPKTEEGS